MDQIEIGSLQNKNSKGNLITPLGSQHDIGMRYMSVSSIQPEKMPTSKRINTSTDSMSDQMQRKLEPKSAILDNIQLLNREQRPLPQAINYPALATDFLNSRNSTTEARVKKLDTDVLTENAYENRIDTRVPSALNRSVDAVSLYKPNSDGILNLTDVRSEAQNRIQLKSKKILTPAPQVSMSQIYVDVALKKDQKLNELRNLRHKIDNLASHPSLQDEDPPSKMRPSLDHIPSPALQPIQHHAKSQMQSINNLQRLQADALPAIEQSRFANHPQKRQSIDSPVDRRSYLNQNRSGFNGDTERAELHANNINYSQDKTPRKTQMSQIGQIKKARSQLNGYRIDGQKRGVDQMGLMIKQNLELIDKIEKRDNQEKDVNSILQARTGQESIHANDMVALEAELRKWQAKYHDLSEEYRIFKVNVSKVTTLIRILLRV